MVFQTFCELMQWKIHPQNLHFYMRVSIKREIPHFPPLVTLKLELCKFRPPRGHLKAINESISLNYVCRFSNIMTSSGAISSASIVSMAPNQEDWGPGPPLPDDVVGPPPEFRIPPPPLPSFMLPDDLDHEEFCQTTSLDTHLDVCDTTFVSPFTFLTFSN